MCRFPIFPDDSQRKSEQVFLNLTWTDVLHLLIEHKTGIKSRYMPFRVQRYQAGGFFASHGDFTQMRDAEKQLAVAIYLSACGGGRLRFEDGDGITPKPGLMVCYRPEMVHESEPVAAGIKYACVTWAIKARERDGQVVQVTGGQK